MKFVALQGSCRGFRAGAGGPRRLWLLLWLACGLAWAAPVAFGEDATDASSDAPDKLAFLPRPIRDGLDVNLWGWAGYLYGSEKEHHSYFDAEAALDVTKSFAGRLALTAQINFIDANNRKFGQLEQAFATVVLNPDSQTLLTVGKFNAGFGAEQRDFWNRLTGTTSLLFGAQPQDLIGVMLTQPIGDTGLKVRPFVVNDFEGHFQFDQPPSAGVTVEYQPSHEWNFALTNWVGPGFARKDEEEGDDEEYYSSPVVTSNWLGPHLNARRGGTLYFADAKVAWNPRPDLTLAAEALLGTTGSSDGRAGWEGAMVLANYDLNDRWRVFGRWSFLDDSAGVVTEIAQRRHELSAGVGFRPVHEVELRAEYRHDFSDTAADVDSVSAHLTFGY